MKTVWKLTPADRGLYIRLAGQILPHLDRAGTDFYLEAAPGLLAEFAAGAILKAENKAFVPETRGELLERAKAEGLILPGDPMEPVTREEAAILALRLLDRMEGPA